MKNPKTIEESQLPEMNFTYIDDMLTMFDFNSFFEKLSRNIN
jgi:hypothetical protein